MAKIGLLGGSFNPAHIGHRKASLAALEALGLDAVWWLVSPQNPLKSEKDMAPYAARFASAEKMAARAPISVSDFEVQAGTQYTVDTISAIQRRYLHHEFIWLMGEDSVANFHQWKDWRALASSIPIAVMTRPGYKSDARTARAMGWLRWFVRPAATAKEWTEWRSPAITFLRLPPDDSSATALRALHPDWHLAYRKKAAG
ncbi:MAG: nicotinate-nucleotide adenylyltransferase [Sphingomonadaceae bacterium]|nr:MAG: nicotinate-nucleotide adenylyltransferase [Sphingomonadaceae bacterium]